MTHKIHNSNNIEALKQYPDNHFDSIVTDPPYGIAFLGKDWDNDTGAMETWEQCYRVLKPGGYLLAFSAARTYHHLATNIEMAGFEIRDQLMWLYASGFPKAQDVGRRIQMKQGVEDYEQFIDTTKNAGFGQTDHARVRAGVEWSTQETQVGQVKCTSPEAKQWEGWKTALKPAHEPIVMARKPMGQSTVDNVLQHGVGALNIDGTRIGDEEIVSWQCKTSNSYTVNEHNVKVDKGLDSCITTGSTGRYPSNVLGEVEGYQKFFFCPKVSREERHIGHKIPDAVTGHIKGGYDDNGERLFKTLDDANVDKGNNHPTVKPVALMKYLITLVTPPNSIVLDPFMGSGSTGMAATELGHEFVGCELDEHYCKIADKRIKQWQAGAVDPDVFNTLFR